MGNGRAAPMQKGPPQAMGAWGGRNGRCRMEGPAKARERAGTETYRKEPALICSTYSWYLACWSDVTMLENVPVETPPLERSP